MKNIAIYIYRALVAPFGVLLALTFGTLFVPKIRAGLALRRQKRIWPTFEKSPIWIHASSGEFEYAKPLIKELKTQDPSRPIVVTYFSPSYAKAIEKFPGVDFCLPVPLDLPGPTRAFLKKLKPQCGLIARTDLWPELLHQANSLNIPLILFSVTKTKNPNLLVRRFYKWLYGYLKAVFTVSSADAEVLKKILPQSSIEAIGDTRFDQVLARLNAPKPLKDLDPVYHQTIVAGSTWAEDEKVLIEALVPLLRQNRVQLIIAPHEPTPFHVDALLGEFKRREIPVEVYSKASKFYAGVLIVDQVGILAELYRWGSMAFVGGSFKGSVHSVMEPLAAGCLTFVGPYHQNNREALEFQKLKSNGRSFVQAVKNPVELQLHVESCLNISDDIANHIRDAIRDRGGASHTLVQRLRALSSELGAIP